MKHLAYTITLFLLLLATLPAVAREVQAYVALSDTTEEVSVGTGSVFTEQANDFPLRLQDKDQNRREDGQPSATVARNARGGYLLLADSLFKRQRISKFYPRKRFLSKAMVDFGAGFTYGEGTDAEGSYSMGFTPRFQLGLTDWATPEHGWRVALQAGQLPLKLYAPATRSWTTLNPLLFGLSAEYLFNITALASRSYASPAPAEISLVVGAELDAINYNDLLHPAAATLPSNRWTYNAGLHLGLRGVLNVSRTTYLYLQPQVGVNKPSTFFSPSSTGGEGFALSGSITAGIGLRRDPRFAAEGHVSDTLKAMRNDWFIELAGGTYMHLDGAKAIGPSASLAFGKWLGYTSGLRLRTTAGYLRYPDRRRHITAEAALDYMWNASRYFAIRSGWIKGQQSPFSVKLAIGAGAAFSRHSLVGTSFTPTLGGGVQLGVRTGGLTEFYLEPRLDLYLGKHIPLLSTTNDKQPDLLASIRAGFSFNLGYHTLLLRKSRNAAFRQLPFQHHLFVEGAAGIITPLSESIIRTNAVAHTLQPAARLSIGKWFTPVHGLRLYGEGGRLKQGRNMGGDTFMGVGAEYLWHMTNSIGSGYRTYRPIELILALGFHSGDLMDKGEPFNPAFSGALQLHYNIDKRWSIFMEPQIRVYGSQFLASVGPNFDPVASLMLGARLRTVGYSYRLACDSASWARSAFIGVAAGLSSSAKQPSLGFSGRVSMGQWFTPVSGLRYNLAYHSLRFDALTRTDRQRKVLIGAEYIMDFSNLSYGYRQRSFHVRPLAGFNLGAGWQRGRQATLEADLHAGLQLAFSIKHGNEFYLEPQLSYVFGQPRITRMNHFHPAFYAGWQKSVGSIATSFADLGRHLREIRQQNAAAHAWSAEGSWRNKWFFEVGGGLNMLWGGAAKRSMRQYAGFGGQAAVGRWFTAMSGVRLRFIGDRLNMEGDSGRQGFELMGLGIDYAHSLTTAIWGYNPDRHIDLNAYTGLRLMWQRGSSRVVPGFNVALQPVVNIGRSFGLYLQPELTLYGKGALQPGVSRSFNFTNALSLGMQMHPQNYDLKAARLLYDEDGGQCFFSVAGGGGMPLRNMLSKRDEWFLTGRLSYGRWFTPVSAWRANVQGWAAPRDFHTRTRSGRMTLGADYLLDVTTLAMSRMDHRPFNFRPLVGFNMGLAYMGRLDGRLHFQGDVHAGVQLGVNASRRVELYVEPQLSHVWSGYSEVSRLTRLHPSVLAGLTYRLTSYAKEVLKDDDAAAQPRSFISVAAGTGFNSHILTGGQEYFRFKMTVDADVAYGRWFDPINGLRVGVGMSTMHLGRTKFPNHQLTLLTLHADYMLNLLSIFRGADALSQRAELAAYLGLSYSFGMAPTRSTHHGPGGEAGFWAGVKVSPKVTLFLEPCIQVQSPAIYQGSSHPIDGTVRLLGGAKFAF